MIVLKEENKEEKFKEIRKGEAWLRESVMAAKPAEKPKPWSPKNEESDQS